MFVASAVEELVWDIEHACGLCFLGPYNKHHGVGKASVRVLTGLVVVYGVCLSRR